MRAVLVLLVLAAGCGRLGFGSRAEDGDGSVDAPIDTPIDTPIDVPLGAPCTSDLECGRCARCDQTCQPEPVVDMFLGHRSTCYLGGNGRRWCTGENNDGQLGLGDAANRSLPTRIADGDGWESLRLFYYSKAFGVRAGQMFEWGAGTLSPTAAGPARADVRAVLGDLNRKCLWFVDGTSDCAGSGTTVWRSLDYGAGHFCGVRASDRTLWCWGTSYSDALGVDLADGATLAMPTQVGTDTDWAEVGVGGRDAGLGPEFMGVTCARQMSGKVLCFGAASLTGSNGATSGPTPELIAEPGPFEWIDVDWLHACAGKADGSVWCWGNDTYGGYVAPGLMSAPAPTRIPGTYQRWIMGGHHACGLDGMMWKCLGWNAHGEMGDGTMTGTGQVVSFCPAQ